MWCGARCCPKNGSGVHRVKQHTNESPLLQRRRPSNTAWRTLSSFSARHTRMKTVHAVVLCGISLRAVAPSFLPHVQLDCQPFSPLDCSWATASGSYVRVAETFRRPSLWQTPRGGWEETPPKKNTVPLTRAFETARSPSLAGETGRGSNKSPSNGAL